MIILRSIPSKNDSVAQSIGLWLFGTLASATGMILMGVSGLTLLKCQRPPQALGYCEVIQTRAFSPTVEVVALAELRFAQLERRYRHRFHVDYQVVLLTQVDKIVLIEPSPTERSWKVEITDRINGFLNTPTQTELELELESRNWSQMVGFGFAAIGTAAGLFTPQILRQLQSHPAAD